MRRLGYVPRLASFPGLKARGKPGNEARARQAWGRLRYEGRQAGMGKAWIWARQAWGRLGYGARQEWGRLGYEARQAWGRNQGQRTILPNVMRPTRAVGGIKLRDS